MKRACAKLLLFAALTPLMSQFALAAGQDPGGARETFNMVAVKVNDQNISVRDVESLYNDSYLVDSGQIAPW